MQIFCELKSIERVVKLRIGFGLNIEQHQKLIMTPELRQAITILQMSSLDLAEFIQQELVENPLLEVNEEEVLEQESLRKEKEVKEEE